MKTIIFPATPIDTTGLATAANQATQITEAQTANTELGDINTELDTQTTELQSVNTELDTQTTELQSINTELNTQTTELQSINTELDTQTTELQSINTELNTQTTELQSINTELDNISTALVRLEIKELTSFIDTSSTNIPASASLPLQVVASTSAIIKKIQSVEDIGEFIGVYKGAASSEVLVGVLPLGGGEIEVNLPASTRISLRNMKNAAIVSGNIILNLLG